MPKSAVDARRDIDDFLRSRSHLAPTDGRRRLMNAVLTVAVERGNAGLSMRAIAKQVNMQPASIYSHFEGGKDELVAETVQSAYIDFLTDVVDSTTAEVSAEEQFAAIALHHVDFQIRSGWTDLWEVLVTGDRTSGYLTDETRESVRTLRSLYREYVIALVAELGGEADADVKGQLVIELLNQISPAGVIVRTRGAAADVREITLGACLAIARSSRAALPVDNGSTPH